MTDKEKIREEVKKLKSQLIKGACSSQIAMETMCKEEAYNEVLTILDSLQEEPVASKVLEDMLNAKTAAESLGISQEEHDRIVDELIYGKEPEYLDDFLALEEIPPKFPLISKKKGIMKLIAPELHSNDDKFAGGFNVLDFNWTEDEVQNNRFPVKLEYRPL